MSEPLPRRQRIPRSLAITVCATCLLVLGVSQVVDVVGARYLHRYDELCDRLISHEREHLESQRRAVVFGEHLDQNAAAWYRMAFAKITPLPTGTRQVLKETVERGFAGDPASLRALLDDRCREVHSPRFQDALRCTYCDWGVGYRAEDARDWNFNTEALILAYCQVLNGHVHANERDWHGALFSYVQTLSYGSDFNAGNDVLNVAGIIIWKLGLQAAGTLVSAVGDDKRFLADAQQQLSRFDGSLPTLRSGFRFRRLWVATRLASNAHEYVDERRAGLGRLLPWRAAAAWRLVREVPLVELLGEAVDVKDSSQLARVASQVEQHLGRNKSEWMANEIRVESWVQFAEEEEKVARSYRALEVAIKLQEWHADHAEYPVDTGALDVPVGLYGLTYDRTDDGKGYRLVAGRGDGAVVLAERRSAQR